MYLFVFYYEAIVRKLNDFYKKIFLDNIECYFIYCLKFKNFVDISRLNLILYKNVNVIKE